MQMSDMEIVGSFRRSHNKKEQVQILADLNGTNKETIIEILKANGFTEEDFGKRVKRRTKAEIEATRQQTEKMPEPEIKGENEASEASAEALPEQIVPETRGLLKDYLEPPELTEDEAEKVERALAIPMAVRVACMERVSYLTDKIIELDKERDTLCLFLEGEVIKDG